MSVLSIELKKCKRSGVIPLMLIIGALGAFYSVTNYAIRKESLLSLPFPPMVLLLTQLYGMNMILNMFAIILDTSMIYNIEHSGNAIKKMYTLPLKTNHIYLYKAFIIIVLLATCIILQNVALFAIGTKVLPPNTFEPSQLISFAFFTFISSMPVMAFMLFVSSRFENMWISLGIGVAGFFSGMTMSSVNFKLFLLNPFVLMMKPAMKPTINMDYSVIAFSCIETLVFLVLGLWMTKHLRYE